MNQKGILIIDDHPIIVEGYINILKSVSEIGKISYSVNIIDALKEINSGDFENKIDLILLDINMPPYEKEGITSGEDLGELIKKKNTNIPVIVLTMINENYRLVNIIKQVKPEGFLLKSDIDAAELIKAVKTVLEGKIYYSQSINKLLMSQISTDIILDNFERNILYFISQGVRTIDLSDYVHLSLPAIEKRKKKLKIKFDIKSGGDLELISRAKELGFL